MAATFTRVKPASWAIGEKLTSAQQNQLDIDHSNSVDVSLLGVNDVTITRTASDPGVPADFTNWGISNGVWVTTTTTVSSITWGLSLPQASTFNAISLILKGAGGHAALPSPLPQASIFKINLNTGAQTLIGSATNDPSVNTTAYQLVHAIPIGPLAEVVDSTVNRYIVQCSSEGNTGGHGVAGALFYGVAVSIIITNLSHHEV